MINVTKFSTKALKKTALLLLLGSVSNLLQAEPANAILELPYKNYEAFTHSGEFPLFAINNLWLLVAAIFVLIMHLGFATIEIGLTRAKNTTNILFKNTLTLALGILLYAAVGFNSMYPQHADGEGNAYVSIGGPIQIPEGEAAILQSTTSSYGDYTLWTDFIFQAMFAATAATILSGAVAERMKLSSYLIIAALLVALFYPQSGYWQWGGGWLSQLGFHDFAGSSLVHGFGGFVSLGVVLILGPRLGKYSKEGIRPIPGHSLPMAAIGVFLLFTGWFGFNGGSVLNADPAGVSYVFVTTALGGVSGAVLATFTAWLLLKKPDLTMSLNGLLAGLVGITAGADVIGIWSAALIGAVAGVLVVVSVIFFDKVRIDDPVGAISVHGVCGVWGTLAVGIFGSNIVDGVETIRFLPQLTGAFAVCTYAFLVGLLLALAVRYTIGIRVSEEEEFTGLDIQEHGMEAYPEFGKSNTSL